MQPQRYALTAAIALAVALMAQAPQARAASVAANAVRFCQASLPAYNTDLRKRPLGIQNEGSTGAFISCGLQWHVWHLLAGITPQAYVTATNRNATATDLTCTLLDGHPWQTINYHTKTLSMASNSSASLVWVPSDFNYFPGTSLIGYENFSCHVPPGVEINLVGFDYYEN